MLGGGGQLLLRGKLVVGVVVIGKGGFAVVVPDVQHAAHGDVQLATRSVVHLLGQFQHPQNFVVHRDGGLARVVIDGFDVHDAVIVVVDVVELVVFQQVCVKGGHLSVEVLFAVAVGDDLRHGVEGIVEDGGVALRAVGGAGSAAGAGRSGPAAPGQ